MTRFDSRLQPRFKARAPWFGPDLQTLRNAIVRPRFDLTHMSPRKLVFSASNATDQLSGYWHRHKQETGKPTVVLIHGLTGSSEATTIRASAFNLLRAGFPVLRLNLRGAGDTARHCASQYHTGLTEDLAAVLDQLPAEAVQGGVLFYGYSLGANQILKFLGERKGFGIVKAAVAVSAPIDPRLAVETLMEARNWFYHRALLKAMQQQARLCDLPASMKVAADAARTIRQFDDFVTAPMHGFADSEDFYESVGAKRLLDRIETPTLILHAEDDPWIPVRSLHAVPWAAYEALTYIEAPGGGHCGFHAQGEHRLWHDDMAIRFFKHVLENMSWGQY